MLDLDHSKGTLERSLRDLLRHDGVSRILVEKVEELLLVYRLTRCPAEPLLRPNDGAVLESCGDLDSLHTHLAIALQGCAIDALCYAVATVRLVRNLEIAVFNDKLFLRVFGKRSRERADLSTVRMNDLRANEEALLGILRKRLERKRIARRNFEEAMPALGRRALPTKELTRDAGDIARADDVVAELLDVLAREAELEIERLSRTTSTGT